MAFMIQCDNKGCHKTNEPKLDPSTNNVYCSECEQVIASVSQFTKNSMKSIGQVRKSGKQAYAVRCEHCNGQALPKLDAKDNFLCAICNKTIKTIKKPFEPLIRAAIKNGNEIK